MVFFSNWKLVIQCKYDSLWIIIIKTMNTIKFLPNNNILLNNKTLLTKIKYTKEFNNYYTIKNNNYVEL
jgi:hypothetical protein